MSSSPTSRSTSAPDAECCDPSINRKRGTAFLSTSSRRPHRSASRERPNEDHNCLLPTCQGSVSKPCPWPARTGAGALAPIGIEPPARSQDPGWTAFRLVRLFRISGLAHRRPTGRVA